MTPKQQRFVAEYLIDLNATQAAMRAGYSKKTAASQAERLLRNADVASAVAKAQRRVLASAELKAERVLEELRRLAFADVRSLFDARGNLKPLHNLTPEEAACVAHFEVVVKNAAAGDGHTDVVHKVRVTDKLKALEMLAKHFNLLQESVKLSADHDLLDALAEGRRRVAQAKAERVEPR